MVTLKLPCYLCFLGFPPLRDSLLLASAFASWFTIVMIHTRLHREDFSSALSLLYTLSS